MNPRLKTLFDIVMQPPALDAKKEEKLAALAKEQLDGIPKSDIKDILNTMNGDGATVLTSACSNGHAPVAKLLLKYGADANISHQNGGTPLMFAAFNAHVDMAKALLEHKADVNAQTKSAGTALTAASMQGHDEMIKVLLKNNANINLLDAKKDGISPLNWAIQEAPLQTVKLLLDKHAKIDLQDKDGTPLMMAANRNRLDVVELLLSKKANPNKDSNGIFPLDWAIARKNLAMIDLLLTHKTNINDPQKLRNFLNTCNQDDTLCQKVMEKLDKQEMQQETEVEKSSKQSNKKNYAKLEKDLKEPLIASEETPLLFNKEKQSSSQGFLSAFISGKQQNKSDASEAESKYSILPKESHSSRKKFT